MTGVQTCALDRKSTRLNSSHTIISYAVFCLKKKNESRHPRPGEAAARTSHTRHHPTRGRAVVGLMACVSCFRLMPFARDVLYLFFFNDTATTEIYTLSLHDALPIYTHHRDLHSFPTDAFRSRWCV